MITLTPKLHKCPYTSLPADQILVDQEPTNDYLRYFINSTAVKKFYSNLHYRLLVKLPLETRNKQIMDKLAQLNDPIFLVLHESVGTDVSQRLKFAQELIDLCMPIASKSIALHTLHQYFLNKSIKDLASVRGSLWETFAENCNQRLSLKKRKFKICANLEPECLHVGYQFFFTNLTEKLYNDFYSAYNTKKKNILPMKGVSDPFVEEYKAYDPPRNEARVISKVKNEKAMVPVQAPYATSHTKFYEKKGYEYEIPKAVPDCGFNHFRELGKVKKTDFSLDLDFTDNSKNVTNTTFFTLLESLPKFDKLKSLSINVSGSNGFGAVGLGYLKTALLKLNLESFTFKAANCQGMNDLCVENIMKGLSKSSHLTTFVLEAPRCPAITESSLESVAWLANYNKKLRKCTINLANNRSLTDKSLLVLRKILDELVLSHLYLHFDNCEKVSQKAKEGIRFFIRNCPKIGFYKLT